MSSRSVDTPEVPERYGRALEVVAERLKEEFGNELLGLLFTGSAAYGTPMKTSDLDLFVLIRPSWRQRRNVIIEGVEVELFINPVHQIRREFAKLDRTTVDMFSRGRIVFDPQGLIAELVAEARHIADQPPTPPADTYRVRYKPSDALRDAEDLLEVDGEAASLQLSVALRETLEALFRLEGRSPPKAKYLLQEVAEHAPDIATDARRVLDDSQPVDARVELLRSLTDRILAPAGGVLVEGQTQPEELHE